MSPSCQQSLWRTGGSEVGEKDKGEQPLFSTRPPTSPHFSFRIEAQKESGNYFTYSSQIHERKRARKSQPVQPIQASYHTRDRDALKCIGIMVRSHSVLAGLYPGYVERNGQTGIIHVRAVLSYNSFSQKAWRDTYLGGQRGNP